MCKESKTVEKPPERTGLRATGKLEKSKSVQREGLRRHESVFCECS